jgi:hypothetical protein
VIFAAFATVTIVQGQQYNAGPYKQPSYDEVRKIIVSMRMNIVNAV